MDLPLKEIHLEGFKSFRDLTKLKFDGSLTAVVGPNGSGKSNVVDAVKWVLGDHSPRSIRASTSLEAIYRPVEGNGLEPSGFCAVSILIDNSEPEAEDEPGTWEVERRYYRSGESVYSINGRTARLKDVRALMAKKGFGLGSLSVVGQGEIDGFLSLVPADRRLVFEDLARISDFKANKRKILGQLDQSARNDERLRDLIGEISVRVEKLTVQAVDARRHAELIEAQDEINAQLAAQQFILALRNVERNEKKLEEIKETLEKAGEVVQASFINLADSKESLERGRKDSVNILSECEQARRELDRARAEERRLTEAGGHLSTLIGTLEREHSERLKRVDAIESRQTELVEIEIYADEERIAADRRRLELNLYLSRRWGYTRACGRERERLQAKVERLAGEGSLFARDAEFHTRRAESVEAESKELENGKIELLEEIDMREVKRVELDRAIERLNNKLLVSEAEQPGIQTAIAENEKLKTGTENKKRELSAEIAGLERERDLLTELEESREGYGDSVRAILDRKDNFTGLHGTVGELVDVRQGSEDLAERALGDSLSFLVVDELEQALRIVETARSENLGTVTVVVLSLVPDVVTSGEENDLLSICKPSPDLRNFISLLLAGAGCLETSAEISPDSLDKTLVCSDGTVFRPPAFISGGSKGAVSEGILTRRGRLRELEEIIAEKQAATDSIQWETARLNSESARLGKDEASVRNSIDEISGRLKQAESALEGNIDGLERAAHDLTGLDTRLTELAVEREGYLENARLAKVGVETVKRIRSDAETDLGNIERELQGLSGQVEDLRSRLQRAIVEEASYREEAKRAREENANLIEELSEAHQTISERKGKLDGIREEAKSKSEELTAASEKRDELEQTLPELERKESEASEKIERLADRVTEAELKLEEAREEVEGLENEVHSQEVRIAELRGGLTGLDRELDRFPQFAQRIRSGDLAGKDIPSRKELSVKLDTLNLELEELGEVNPLAIEEELTAKKRLDELRFEREDLLSAEEQLRKALEEVEAQSQKAFTETFNAAKDKFTEVFASLFPGGSGELSLTELENPLESGIDVKIRFPGKGEMDLLQFSGGERALIALALLFAILKVKPSSFTLLDEVEASLDDINTQKFLDYLDKEFGGRQFVFITHNKITMERADRLYGVTMRDSGVSQVVSVDLKRLQEEGIDEVLGLPN